MNIDPHSMELLSNALSLAATFLKHREERNESADAQAFRDWLQEVVFPELLGQSDQTLTTVVSLKAHQREQYETLLEIGRASCRERV